jgi:hypothetical protein
LEEVPMARPIARDAEEFARLMLQTLEQRGPEAGWITARELFEQTAARHPGHAYVGLVAAKPARRAALTAGLERVREAELPHIERRKDGLQRGAAVLYRAAPRRVPEVPQPNLPVAVQASLPAAVQSSAPPDPQPGVRLDLQLPYEPPASHPLLNQRRAAEARREQPSSARRTAMTECAPTSPWRRRLLPPRLPLPPGTLDQAWSSVRLCWGRLRATVSGLASGAGGGS